MLYKVKYYDFRHENEVTLNLQAHTFLHATSYMIDYLNNSIGEEGWEIIQIKTLFNFADATQEQGHPDWTPETVECPHCALEHTVLDMVMEFECWECGEKIKVADNGWITINCGKCGTTIERKDLFRDPESGKWIYKDDEEETEE